MCVYFYMYIYRVLSFFLSLSLSFVSYAYDEHSVCPLPIKREKHMLSYDFWWMARSEAASQVA